MVVENLTREERLRLELIQIRREARVTQKELARLARVSISTVKAIERGDPRPKAETLHLIAEGAATDGAERRDAAKAEAYSALAGQSSQSGARMRRAMPTPST